MKGVKKARRKFQSQLEAVASAPCLARVRVGKVSPIRIQMPLRTNIGQVSSTIRKETHGAQVVAKPQMNMQAETIITVCIVQRVNICF